MTSIRKDLAMAGFGLGLLLWACGGAVPVGNLPQEAPYGSPWPMHAIDDRFRGANALGEGDLNGDGFVDYVTNYEFDQRYVIALHPGQGGDPRKPWPTIVAYRLATGTVGTDTEHAALADCDGDGNLDVIGAQGWHVTGFWEGQNPGVRIVWGPPRDRLFEESAWLDAGRIPETIDEGHFLYVVTFDFNGDGAVDIIVGGRVLGSNGRSGGIKWIEAPANRGDRRDLSRWHLHDIDPAQYDGHGFVLDDIDLDGDQDLADANADFDTPESEETVHWYENPGTGTLAQLGAWTKHEIYRGSEFYPKPQLAVADLDGDGRRDLITQVENDVYWFRKTGLNPVTWERVVIPKPPLARWLSRPIRVADLNGDGKPDLFGMVTHDAGVVAGDTAAAFWMEYEGDEPRADNWKTHVVKWGSGKPMAAWQFGEKWDQVQFADIDRDGDLDIVANCEEWWVDRLEIAPFGDRRLDPTSVAVVWFENRLHESPYACRERNDVCVIEAEHYTDLRDGTWIERARYAGAAGDGYMQDHHSIHAVVRESDDSLGLEYEATVAGGRYFLWLRRLVPSRWGPDLGGADSDSVWVSFDDQAPAGAFDDEASQLDQWVWVRADTSIALAPGRHVVRLRVREGGYAVDRILLARDATYVPSGPGPGETLNR